MKVYKKQIKERTTTKRLGRTIPFSFNFYYKNGYILFEGIDGKIWINKPSDERKGDTETICIGYYNTKKDFIETVYFFFNN